MNYANIKKRDIANGTGVRVSLFVSGCTHHCEGCFNSETWSFNYGDPFTEDVENEVIEALTPSYMTGLSLLGGEPFEPVNQKGLLNLLRRVKKELPQKTIWCYTGYTFDKDLIPGGRVHCEATDEMLSMIDVLVDGKFMQDLYDISLKFRGSSNQRIIDVKKSVESGTVILHMS
ncbi:MAG: anaerobic ribonucleoside-triphosphate reductase activating protein [Clostridia bacterium]|nr:anaerobic ribonucleoside-triphosphate reductase activating protein [Clostridia bacterium]